MKDMRCKNCNAKLAELSVTAGTVSIMCNRNLGRGLGSCKTMNVYSTKSQEQLSQKPINAI